MNRANTMKRAVIRPLLQIVVLRVTTAKNALVACRRKAGLNAGGGKQGNRCGCWLTWSEYAHQCRPAPGRSSNAARSKLSADQISDLSTWVEMGLPWPTAAKSASRAGSTSDHWASRPPVRPDLPLVKNSAWCFNPIDRLSWQT
jgi:hypothetical protein